MKEPARCRFCGHIYKDHDFDKLPPSENPAAAACTKCPDGWCSKPENWRKTA